MSLYIHACNSNYTLINTVYISCLCMCVIANSYDCVLMREHACVCVCYFAHMLWKSLPYLSCRNYKNKFEITSKKLRLNFVYSFYVYLLSATPSDPQQSLLSMLGLVIKYYFNYNRSVIQVYCTCRLIKFTKAFLFTLL